MFISPVKICKMDMIDVYMSKSLALPFLPPVGSHIRRAKGESCDTVDIIWIGPDGSVKIQLDQARIDSKRYNLEEGDKTANKLLVQTVASLLNGDFKIDGISKKAKQSIETKIKDIDWSVIELYDD